MRGWNLNGAVNNKLFRRLLIGIVVLILSAGTPAQSTQTIKYHDQDYALHVVKYSGAAYVSLVDLSSKLHFQYFRNADKKKIELRFSKVSLIFTANNPFLVSRSREDASVHTRQLTQAPILVGSDIYIPLKTTIAALHELADAEINLPDGTTPVVESAESTSESIPEAEGSFTYSVNEKANGTLVTFNARQKIKKYTSGVKDGNITLEFPGVKLGSVPKSFASKKGTVKSIEWQQEKGGATVTIKVAGEPSAHEFIAEGDKTLLLTVHNKKFAGKPAETNPARQKWKFDVIVLDAGHGGKDYGAIGVHNTVEKDINLGVALKLGGLIKQNMKDVKVVYTRKDDTFIELYKRGKIANENNGKLFISIHCNSVQAKVGGPNGYEIYLLRPGRTAEAINIAERENSVINYEDKPSRYGKLTDENFILVSMAHSSYMRYSEKFAEILDGHLKNGSKITSRGIKQAGFYVLVGAAMPSILFETGYVTNESDAAYMRSESGQKEIASAIFQAIKSFKGYYAKEIESE